MAAPPNGLALLALAEVGNGPFAEVEKLAVPALPLSSSCWAPAVLKSSKDNGSIVAESSFLKKGFEGLALIAPFTQLPVVVLFFIMRGFKFFMMWNFKMIRIYKPSCPVRRLRRIKMIVLMMDK